MEIHALFLEILRFEFVTLFVKHPVGVPRTELNPSMPVCGFDVVTHVVGGGGGAVTWDLRATPDPMLSAIWQ